MYMRGLHYLNFPNRIVASDIKQKETIKPIDQENSPSLLEKIKDLWKSFSTASENPELTASLLDKTKKV